MKLRHYSFPIVLMVTTLFSSCKQSLNMQGGYEENELIINNDNSNTALLFEVVKTGNKELVQEVLLNNVDINAKDEEGWTPLHWAARDGKRGIVELLINNGADLNAKDNDGRTPFHWAAENGRKDVVKLLVSYGGKIYS